MGVSRCSAGYPPRGRSLLRSHGRISLLGGIPASRPLATPVPWSYLAARRDTRLAAARYSGPMVVSRCSAGYPTRGRSLLRSHGRISLLGGIPASRPLATPVPWSYLAARRDTRLAAARYSGPMVVSRCSAGYPPRGRSLLRSHGRISLLGGIPASRPLATPV